MFRLGLRTMFTFFALVLLGAILIVAGNVQHDTGMRGAGMASAFLGGVGMFFLGLRWWIFRGIG